MNHEQMQNCITQCWQCRHICQETLFNHCLIEGGSHLEANHVKLMTDCIQICQTAADFMTRNSEMHKAICEACAKICEACAKSCEEIDDETMEKCAMICRKCAKTCYEMSS